MSIMTRMNRTLAESYRNIVSAQVKMAKCYKDVESIVNDELSALFRSICVGADDIILKRTPWKLVPPSRLSVLPNYCLPSLPSQPVECTQSSLSSSKSELNDTLAGSSPSSISSYRLVDVSSESFSSDPVLDCVSCSDVPDVEDGNDVRVPESFFDEVATDDVTTDEVTADELTADRVVTGAPEICEEVTLELVTLSRYPLELVIVELVVGRV